MSSGAIVSASSTPANTPLRGSVHSSRPSSGMASAGPGAETLTALEAYKAKDSSKGTCSHRFIKDYIHALTVYTFVHFFPISRWLPVPCPLIEWLIVIVRFKSVGNAPIMKQNFYKISASNRFQTVIQFLRKELGWKSGDALVSGSFYPVLSVSKGSYWENTNLFYPVWTLVRKRISMSCSSHISIWHSHPLQMIL